MKGAENAGSQQGEYKCSRVKVRVGNIEILASSIQSQRYYPTPKAVLRCQQGKSDLLIKKCLSIFYVGLRNVFVGVELDSDVEQLLTEPWLQDISSGRDARDYSPNMMTLTLTGQTLYVNSREVASML